MLGPGDPHFATRRAALLANRALKRAGSGQRVDVYWHYAGDEKAAAFSRKGEMYSFGMTTREYIRHREELRTRDNGPTRRVLGLPVSQPSALDAFNLARPGTYLTRVPPWLARPSRGWKAAIGDFASYPLAIFAPVLAFPLGLRSLLRQRFTFGVDAPNMKSVFHVVVERKNAQVFPQRIFSPVDELKLRYPGEALRLRGGRFHAVLGPYANSGRALSEELGIFRAHSGPPERKAHFLPRPPV